MSRWYAAGESPAERILALEEAVEDLKSAVRGLQIQVDRLLTG